VMHYAKASSAGTTEGSGNSRGLFRRAFATRGASCDAKGSGARSNGRLRATLAVLALAIAAFAVTAAPASAAPSMTAPVVSDVSYTTAHVTSEVNPEGGGFTSYAVQVSTNGTDWTNKASGFFFKFETLNAELTGLDDGTQYLVRLAANAGFGGVTEPPEAISAGPNPSFTTLTASPPTIPGAVAATGVYSTSARATAEVNRPVDSDDVKCHFEYVTDADFTATGFAGATVRDCEQNPIKQADAGTKAVTAPLGCTTPVTDAGNCLSPSTTYHLRLVAENASGTVTKDAASTFTTLPPVSKPTIIAADDASEVGKRSAQLTGEIERPAGTDPALDVNCRFEYVTDAQFTSTGFAGASQAPCLGRNEVQSLTIAATAGQFRLTYSGQIYGGQTNGTATEDLPFNATPIEVHDALERVMGTNAVKISGGPGDGAGSTPYRITFVNGGYLNLGEQEQSQLVVTDGTTPLAGTAAVTTLTNGATAFEVLNGPPTNQPKTVDVNAELFELAPNTSYHLRLVAENGGGIDTQEAAGTFKTIALIPPTATLDSIDGFGYTSVSVTGSVDPGNQGVLGTAIQASPTGKEEWQSGGNVGAITAPTQFSGTLPGLKPGTTYQVRLSGIIREASERGEASDFFSLEPYLEFTTKGTDTPATATLNPVTDITATTAHLSGTVNPNAPAGPLDAEGKAAYKTDWHFECTPECPDNAGASHGAVGAEEGAQPVSFDATRLEPNTFYEVKLITTNSLGTVETPVQAFQTPLIAPTVSSTPGGSDGRGGYFLEGIVNSNNTKVTSCKFEYGTTATYPNTYEAPCLPSPSGPNEVQLVNVDATEGQFKLSFRGQTTVDLSYNATPAEVQAALRALSKIGSTGVNVSGTAGAYKVTFAGGGVAGANVEPLKSSDGTTPLGGGGGVSVSTETEGGTNRAVSVETHLEALTVGSTYHFRIFATSAGGSASTVDRTFIPTLDPVENCPNEQLRKENSSFALPECRAYEMVTPPGKEGFGADFRGFDGGDRVAYWSVAGNIARSGQGTLENAYVTARSATGWETIPNLNGSSGSIYDDPTNFAIGATPPPYGGSYSSDLLSSIWFASRSTDGPTRNYYLRGPDGTFTLIGKVGDGSTSYRIGGISKDLSHLVITQDAGGGNTFFGPGVYEFVGVGNEQPRRVDIDNNGNSICGAGGANSNAVSNDGRVIVFTACGPGGSVWARVEGTTSVKASASQCTRVDCNAAADAHFVGAAKDGSRVFFTTTQQLVNGDTDQSTDLYACDIPTAPQTPIVPANPCADLIEVTATEAGGAGIEDVLQDPGGGASPSYALSGGIFSDDGAAVYFYSTNVLADNEDALGETALAGDRNVYVWRSDAAHPSGETAFVARLDAKDIGGAQITPDDRHLVFTTASRLLETDTDNTRDVYRYDADTGELIRASTNASGVGGNGDFEVRITSPSTNGNAISDDGTKLVFATAEALSSADGNGEFDTYLWTPDRVSLISSGSSGSAPKGNFTSQSVIDPSGRDIYFVSAQSLTPADGDDQNDIYDARIGGGFSFAQAPGCSGESCQPGASASPVPRSLESKTPGSGNPKPLPKCPKNKVRKHNKCVKKPAKKHSGKKHHGKKAGHSKGGSK
jgi:hypothetical protein